jgi:hypothetical protein
LKGACCTWILFVFKALCLRFVLRFVLVHFVLSASAEFESLSISCVCVYSLPLLLGPLRPLRPRHPRRSVHSPVFRLIVLDKTVSGPKSVKLFVGKPNLGTSWAETERKIRNIHTFILYSAVIPSLLPILNGSEIEMILTVPF